MLSFGKRAGYVSKDRIGASGIAIAYVRKRKLHDGPRRHRDEGHNGIHEPSPRALKEQCLDAQGSIPFLGGQRLCPMQRVRIYHR